LAELFDVHPNQITARKSQLEGSASEVFGSGGGTPAIPAIDVKSLHARIGELTLENDFFRRSAHQGGIAERKAMIDREHDLSITKQAEILKVSRGSVHYLPRPVSSTDLDIMRQLDRLHLEYPFAGSRMLRGLLVLHGCKVGRRM
jgi:putative transposase